MMLEGERVVDGIKGVTELGLWVDWVAFFLVMWMEKVGWKVYMCISKSGLLFCSRASCAAEETTGAHDRDLGFGLMWCVIEDRCFVDMQPKRLCSGLEDESRSCKVG